MTRRTLVLVTALLVAVLVLGVTVHGQDEGREDDDRQAPDEAPRDVEVRTDERGVRIQLERTDRPGADPVEVAFDTANATLSIAYGPDEAETPPEPRLGIDLGALLEYRDANGNGSFDRGEEVVSGWRLDPRGREVNETARWAPANVSETSRQEREGKTVVLPAQIGDAGSFEIRLTAFGTSTQIDDTRLKPTGVQVTLTIAYPFQANGTDLVLTSTVWAPEGAEIGQQHRAFAGDAEGLAVTQRYDRRAVSFLFAWQNTSTVDGRVQPVEKTVIPSERAGQAGVTSPEEEQRRRSQYNGNGSSIDAGENATVSRFGLSYERGDRIVHHAKAEVAIASIEDGNGAPAVSVGLALAVLAAVGVLHRRTGPA